MSDLARAIAPRPVTLDFIAVSSYGAATKSSGEVRLLKDLDAPLQGRDVIIVEDIVDTGLTLSYLQDVLRARDPQSLRTACLLSKPSRRKVDVKVEYIGFEIEDKFVVGYGLDHAGQFRHLPSSASRNKGRAESCGRISQPSIVVCSSTTETCCPLPSNIWTRWLSRSATKMFSN